MCILAPQVDLFVTISRFSEKNHCFLPLRNDIRQELSHKLFIFAEIYQSHFDKFG